MSRKIVCGSITPAQRSIARGPSKSHCIPPSLGFPRLPSAGLGGLAVAWLPVPWLTSLCQHIIAWNRCKAATLVRVLRQALPLSGTAYGSGTHRSAFPRFSKARARSTIPHLAFQSNIGIGRLGLLQYLLHPRRYSVQIETDFLQGSKPCLHGGLFRWTIISRALHNQKVMKFIQFIR